MSPLAVGETAPDFHLRRTFEEHVELSSMLRDGPVVVAFYVFDFGDVWSHELSQLGAEIGKIREMGADLVAIAVTPTFAQIAFARHLGVDFPLLSDWEGEIADAYGVWYDVWKGHRGLAKRSLFIVDRDGRVAYAWSTEDALVLPDVEEMMGALRRLVGSG